MRAQSRRFLTLSLVSIVTLAMSQACWGQDKPGDFNFDGHVDAKDIAVMEAAFANPSAWESTYNVTADTFNSVADVNGSGVINNAQIQSLLNLLKSGGGSTTVVPEPSTIVLAAAGLIGLLAIRRNKSST
jgi:Dockerin type I domain/PEP-CTERM motif